MDLTATEWDEMKKPDTGYWRITNIIMDRIRRCGVKHLAEETTRRGVSLVVLLMSEKSGELPSHNIIWQMKEEFKQCFHTSSRTSTVQGLKQYP